MNEKSESDETILANIKRLVHDEHELHRKKTREPEDESRLAAVRTELRQCWDVLRQRRALREFGGDPDQARVRPGSVVDRYV